MAGITLITAIDVTGAFSGCDSTIVTTDTGSHDLGMIHRTGGNRCPGCGRFFMTGLASIGAVNVVGIFSTGGYAVMTTNTVINKRRMIHDSTHCPALRVMAGVAFIRGGHMCWTFTGSNHPIMTTGTHTNNFRMIHCVGSHRDPRGRSRLMAGITHIRCGDVIDALTGRNTTIVATLATAHDLRMIHSGIHRTPDDHVVASLTQVGSVDMCLALTGGTDAIMTIDAGLPVNSTMIKQGNLPIAGVMAHITGFIGRHMVWALPGSDDAIVTTGTGTDYLRVIH